MLNLWAMRGFAALLLGSLLVFGGCRWQARLDAGAIVKANQRAEQVIAEYREAELAASEKARSAEQRYAEAVNAAAGEYERGRQDAQALANRTAADLRAGNVRLRREIAALAARNLPDCPAASGEPADAAERGAELAGAAVGVGRACDARVSALIRAYDGVRGGQ